MPNEPLFHELSDRATSPLRIFVAPEHGGVLAAVQFKHRGQWRDLGLNVTKDPAALTAGRAALFHCAPYTGRVAEGVMQLDGGRQFRLLADWHPHALHGFARRARFSVQSGSPSEIVMTLSSDAQRYPYPSKLEFRQIHRLAGNRFTTSMEVRNVGDEISPVGGAVHPIWRRMFDGLPGTFQLQFKTQSHFPRNPAYPTEAMALGSEAPLPERLNFATLRSSPGDFDDSMGGWDGEARIVWAEAGVELITRSNEGGNYLHIWDNPSGFPDHFALEPFVSLGNAINARAAGYGNCGLSMLKKGESVRWETTFELRLS